jgi:hypothetical protein
MEVVRYYPKWHMPFDNLWEKHMSKPSTVLIAFLFLVGVQAQAVAATAQQNKMKTCNAEAKTKALKGDERKAFMSECLSSKKDDAAPATSDSAAASKEKK